MKTLSTLALSLCMVGLVGCATKGVKGLAADAVKSGQEEATKSAEEVEAAAEEAKASALKTSFEESFSAQDATTKDLRGKLEAHEGKYQEFFKAATKKVKRAKEFKKMAAAHDAALPEIEKLGPRYDEIVAWVETTKEAPTEADVTKLNEDMGALSQQQGEHIAKYGEWRATMEKLKAKFKMKINLELPKDVPAVEEGAAAVEDAAEEVTAAAE